MSCLDTSLLLPFSSYPKMKIPEFHLVHKLAIPIFKIRRMRRDRKGILTMATADGAHNDNESTKLITFLGKGGSGKTTLAIFAAQHYAMAGLKTCLVIHSQDPTAEYLLNCKIETSPVTCNNNLFAVRLETTKMLLEPLKRMKETDARLNLTQGVIEGVVGEELGVLPGMDSLFSALALGSFLGYFMTTDKQINQKDKFDIVIFDGISSEETIRMIGGISKSRLYLKYMRKLAEKTDFGRLAGPSIVRFIDETMGMNNKSSNINGKLSSEIWDHLERTLEKGSSIFEDPVKFSCYLVVDSKNALSLKSAERYWGCAIQAGAPVSGAFSFVSPNSSVEHAETVKRIFSLLPFASMPHISLCKKPDWKEILLNYSSQDARNLLSLNGDKTFIFPTVKFDIVNKSIALLMPGFDKSEIKLYQFRGGSELLVEAGDQRRVVRLPPQLQGKVGGAKFTERSLVIKMH